MNKKGFSLIELVLALSVGSGLMIGAGVYYSNQQKQKSYMKEAEYLRLYSKQVVNFANANQALIYGSGFSNINVNLDQLEYFKYISSANKDQYVVRDPNTGSALYPCTNISITNGRMAGFTYYRTDDAKLSQQTYQSDVSKGHNEKYARILTSIQNFGGNVGALYSSNNQYLVKSSNGNWDMDANSKLSSYLVNNSNDYLKVAGITSSCKGQYVATPSVIIPMDDLLGVINPGSKTDDTAQQNSNDLLNSNSNNNITSINLDSQSITDKSRASINKNATTSLRNSLVFQTNLNCVMDPSKLSTMQDYDPYATVGSNCASVNAIDCGQLTVPNKFGCRNKQLSLMYSQGQRCTHEFFDSNQNKMVCDSLEKVDNVVSSGFTAVDNSTNANQNLNLAGYLGGLNATSIQPTAEVKYGDPCSIDEVGSIAKQQYNPSEPSMFRQIINKNQGILVCQKNPLCSDLDVNLSEKKKIPACWLSSMKSRIEINFRPEDKVLAFKAPKGFAILDKNGFEPRYSTTTTISTDMRDFTDGAKGGGKGYSWSPELYSTGEGNWNSYDIYSGGCGGYRSKWRGTRKSFTNARVDTQAQFKVNGNDFLYFSPYWLSSNNIEKNIDANKGFTEENGVSDGLIYRDLGKGSIFGKDIVNRNSNVKTINNGVVVLQTNCNEPRYSTTGWKCSLYSVGKYVPDNLDGENHMVSNKFTLSGPYNKILNSRITLRTVNWEANGMFGGRPHNCDTWRSPVQSYKVFAYPSYITRVVITNDLSEITLSNGNPPAPSPVYPDCNSSNIPQNIKDQMDSQADVEQDRDSYTSNMTYGVYMNPLTPKKTYTSEVISNMCSAKLFADDCIISDANKCSYFLNIDSTDPSLSFQVADTRTLNKGNYSWVGVDEFGKYSDFTTGGGIIANIFKNGIVIESNIVVKNIIIGENSLFNRNTGDDDTGQIQTFSIIGNTGVNYGSISENRVEGSCNKAIACNTAFQQEQSAEMTYTP